MTKRSFCVEGALSKVTSKTGSSNNKRNKETMPAYTFMKESKGAGSTVKVRFTSNDDDDVSRFAIGYWSIRGLGAPLRMMLCAAKVNHDIYLYDLVEKKDNGWTSEYFVEKSDLVKQAPLMNLPFVVDRQEERFVCQTNACFVHLGTQLNMLGSTSMEQSQCLEFLCEIYDIRNIMTDFAYNKYQKDAVKTIKEEAQGVMEAAKRNFLKLESYFQQRDVLFLVGNRMSAPDFHLFEMLDQYSGLCHHFELNEDDDFIAPTYPKLKAFYENFISLE